VDVELRTIEEADVAEFVRSDGYAFGTRWIVDETAAWPRAELDRAVGAVVDGEFVATGRNFSLEVTLPGGAAVPAAGVSWISTRPTHRRRGLLNRVMRYLIEESRSRGEVASMLTASEGGIYPRFGYGVATRVATLELPRAGLEFRGPIPAATLRMVEPDAAQTAAIALFERLRPARTGTVSRPDAWWPDEWAHEDWIDPKRRFDVVAEIDGEVVGTAMWAVEGDWIDGYTHKTVAVRDLLAVSPEAELVLWHFLANIDQTIGVRAWNRPLDDLLPWLLTDARHVRTTSVRDFLWLRPIDTAALLSGRTYAEAGSLTVRVEDPFLELPETAGTFTIDGGPDGAKCLASGNEPDLVLAAAELGAIALGGVRPSLLARAGRIHASDPAALQRADAMFVADREPYASTWF
jgi:predicted acetyltransferase